MKQQEVPEEKPLHKTNRVKRHFSIQEHVDVVMSESQKPLVQDNGQVINTEEEDGYFITGRQ